jgi:hypothetical protein
VFELPIELIEGARPVLEFIFWVVRGDRNAAAMRTLPPACAA